MGCCCVCGGLSDAVCCVSGRLETGGAKRMMMWYTVSLCGTRGVCGLVVGVMRGFCVWVFFGGVFCGVVGFGLFFVGWWVLWVGCVWVGVGLWWVWVLWFFWVVLLLGCGLFFLGFGCCCFGGGCCVWGGGGGVFCVGVCVVGLLSWLL
ncbi:hypothetical protein [Neisseria sp. P0024.S002]|uniref:hypothetical protein n=1 Tax=Neisseria sp. P0024.S002 TaxID=3436846 RepID=UPI003F8114D9